MDRIGDRYDVADVRGPLVLQTDRFFPVGRGEDGAVESAVPRDQCW